MNRYLFLPLLLLGALCNPSCVSNQVVEETTHERDSLITVVADKDSLLNAVFLDINAIAENLSAIKTRENIISVAASQEGVNRPIEDIQESMAAIDRLLQENRAKISSLEQTAAHLRKANVRIGELEKTIKNLHGQLREKNEEISRLRSDLQNKEHQVAQLTQQVEEGLDRENRQSEQISRLTDEKDQWENQSNRIYYIVDSEENLRNAQIINKGRNSTVSGSNRLDSFTQMDLRLLEEIPIGHKKVTIHTAHPDGSYQLITTADKVVTKLVIDDPDRFWESSRILIISYKK